MPLVESSAPKLSSTRPSPSIQALTVAAAPPGPGWEGRVYNGALFLGHRRYSLNEWPELAVSGHSLTAVSVFKSWNLDGPAPSSNSVTNPGFINSGEAAKPGF